MKILISTVLMVFFTTIVWGQTLERTKKGYRYEDKDISTKTLKQLYHQNPEALKAYKKGNLKRNSSAGFYLAGGAYLGGRIGYFTATGEFDWKGAGAGAGLVLAGLWISKNMNNHFDRAVGIFNKKNAKKTSTFKLQPTSENIGFIISF